MKGIISREQDIMIDMLLRGETISDIANKVGVSRQTIYSWKDRDYIKGELEARRHQLKKAANNRIINTICTCVDNIIDLANNSTDQRVKLQANKYLIDQAIGSPSVVKEEKTLDDISIGDKDVNALKKELDDIKNLKVVK